MQVYVGGIISEKNLFGCPFLKLPRLAHISQSPHTAPLSPPEDALVFCWAPFVFCLTPPFMFCQTPLMFCLTSFTFCRICNPAVNTAPILVTHIVLVFCRICNPAVLSMRIYNPSTLTACGICSFVCSRISNPDTLCRRITNPPEHDKSA